MIELKELLMGMVENTVDSTVQISGLALDSRCVEPGDLFFALPGTQCDGKQYISDAVARGAAAVLREHEASPLGLNTGAVPVIAVKNVMHKVSDISARFYEEPSREMTLIGITGTNGKTSCAYFLNQALELLGQESALIGTLGYGQWNKLRNTEHTTPDAITLQKILAELKRDAVKYVAMEVSSHGLQQGRVNGCNFELAVFTNLTHDHLDYHGDFENYKSAKQQLFLKPELRTGAFNLDDPVGQAWYEAFEEKGVSKGFSRDPSKGDVSLMTSAMTAFGLEMVVQTFQGRCEIKNPNLFGEFNVENLLSVVTVLVSLGFPVPQIASAVSKLKGVPGRLQKLPEPPSAKKPSVFIDYAHTPNALENVLRSCRELISDQGRLICLFGCGGERDREKRPLMGGIAERLADQVVISADNSRSENTLDIANDILDGVMDKKAVVVIEDRLRAIEYAVAQATQKDLVLLVGKGAEKTQTLSHGTFEFSDYDAALKALRKRGLH